MIREHPVDSSNVLPNPKPQIDPQNPLDGDRKEVLVAAGDQGSNWHSTSMTIPLVSGKPFYRVRAYFIFSLFRGLYFGRTYTISR